MRALSNTIATYQTVNRIQRKNYVFTCCMVIRLMKASDKAPYIAKLHAHIKSIMSNIIRKSNKPHYLYEATVSTSNLTARL